MQNAEFNPHISHIPAFDNLESCGSCKRKDAMVARTDRGVRESAVLLRNPNKTLPKMLGIPCICSAAVS